MKTYTSHLKESIQRLERVRDDMKGLRFSGLEKVIKKAFEQMLVEKIKSVKDEYIKEVGNG